MIIFEGKSPKPVYLYINDDTAELRDASHQGKSVWETEETLKKSLQGPVDAFRASAKPVRTRCCSLRS